MPPSYSDIRLLPCDFRYLDHCVQAMAKAYVDNITGSDDSKKFMRGYLNWGYLWLGTQIVYLDGWDGLGASSVLRAIAKSLASKEEMWNVEWIRLCNPVLIHIDCSTWQSIRVVQREVAEQLNLPSWVMEKFDRQDEEDDFDGVDQGSRAEINDVKSEICRSVFDRGFFLVLHNGGNKEISLANLGLLSNFSCTVFWTFRGRFRVDPKLIDNVVWMRNKVATYHEYYYCYQQDSDNSDLLLHAEAEEVAQKHGINPAVVVECVKYMLDRNHMSLHNINHDWALHASNYWICDGIIPQAQGIREPCAWLLGEALHQDMEFLIGYLSSHELSRQGCTDQVDLHHMRMSDEYRPYFISTKTCGFILNPDGIVPDKFQHSEQIRVLKLSRCTFRFASPPFLFCHSLRFLCLDHCRDQGVSSIDAKEEEEIITSWPCFQGLWVLDVRYTHWDEILSAHMLDLMTQLRELNVMGAQNWDMSHLHGQLSNIHKLRVTKSTCCNSEETAGQNLFLEMKRMELFEFSENHTTEGMKRLSGAARSTSLKTVIVGACVGLENISFRGCQELKDLFFTGLFAILEELDLSNTAIKFLDLKNVEAAHLKRLILLGCEKLRAILWPPKDKRAQYLEVLRIDNTQSASSSSPEKWEENIKEDSTCIGRSSSSASAGGKEPLGSVQAASFDFNWYISMSDARLFRSIVPVEQYLQGKCVCIEMDSYPASNVVSGGIQFQGAHGIRNQTDHYSPYGKDGMVVEGHPHVVAASEGAIMTWACPPAPTLTAHDCYFHIQDEERKKKGRRLAPSLPALICNITNVLHFHNNLSITCFRVPPDTKWNCLEWCKVERCSELSFVFYTDQKSGDNTIFPRLRTFWASQLPEAYHIWTWNPRSMQPGGWRGDTTTGSTSKSTRKAGDRGLSDDRPSGRGGSKSNSSRSVPPTRPAAARYSPTHHPAGPHVIPPLAQSTVTNPPPPFLFPAFTFFFQLYCYHCCCAAESLPPFPTSAISSSSSSSPGIPRRGGQGSLARSLGDPSRLSLHFSGRGIWLPLLFSEESPLAHGSIASAGEEQRESLEEVQWTDTSGKETLSDRDKCHSPYSCCCAVPYPQLPPTPPLSLKHLHLTSVAAVAIPLFLIATSLHSARNLCALGFQLQRLLWPWFCSKCWRGVSLKEVQPWKLINKSVNRNDWKGFL